MAKHFRHRDSDQWYRMSAVVKKRRAVETPWGEAWAEVGTFVMTHKNDSAHKIIATQDDLENYWTDEPVPAPPEPEPEIHHTVTFSDESSTLPGADLGA